MIDSCICLFIHSFVRSFIHSFIHLFIRSFIQSFVHSFVRSLIHWFIDSLIHWLEQPETGHFVARFCRIAIAAISGDRRYSNRIMWGYESRSRSEMFKGKPNKDKGLQLQRCSEMRDISKHLPRKSGTPVPPSSNIQCRQETCAADAISPTPQVGQNRDRCSPVTGDWGQTVFKSC